MDLQHRHVHADRRLHADRPLIAAVAAAAALLTAVPAAAQVSVEVSPLRIELAAGPGSTTTQAITITNAGKEPVRVRAILTDWELSKDGAPQFESAVEGGPFSARTWVRIAPPEQVVDAAKEATVRFSMTVPAGVEPGGYRAGVLFEFAPATGDPVGRAREVQFKSRIATLIYVNIGEPAMAGELTDLRLRANGSQVQVIATLRNTSRRYVRTKGTLVLYDRDGKSVREVPVPDVPLLPQSEREVAIVAIDPEKGPALPPGEYRVEVRIDVGLPAVLVGETTMKLPQ
jgi:P pilus assembly chaperone PapD